MYMKVYDLCGRLMAQFEANGNLNDMEENEIMWKRTWDMEMSF